MTMHSIARKKKGRIGTLYRIRECNYELQNRILAADRLMNQQEIKIEGWKLDQYDEQDASKEENVSLQERALQIVIQ